MTKTIVDLKRPKMLKHKNPYKKLAIQNNRGGGGFFLGTRACVPKQMGVVEVGVIGIHVIGLFSFSFLMVLIRSAMPSRDAVPFPNSSIKSSDRSVDVEGGLSMLLGCKTSVGCRGGVGDNLWI